MSHRRRWLVALLVPPTFGAVAAPPATAAPQPPPAAQAAAGYVVVVHASNPTPALSRDQVARLFLRKVSRWPSGAPSLPVDLRADAPARVAFSKGVLAKSVPSVKAYWQERIFSGRDVPPPEQPTEAQAVAFVRANAGAVAYVSPAAELPRGVRTLSVTE